MPQRHLAHNASRQDAPQPKPGAGGACGAAGGAAPVPLMATGPAAGRPGACAGTAPRTPGFNAATARCAGVAAVTTVLGVAARRGVVLVDVEVGGVAGVEGTPRSRSPIFGKGFICSSQY